MRGQAIYRALLHFYPAAFRDEYGNQMFLMFAEQLGEARRTGRPFDRAALWGHAAWDALTIAPQEHCHVIAQDTRFTLRSLAARPGFAAVAILSLALGIGANTAIFSLWNGLLHASLPMVAHPEQLVMLSDPASSGVWHGDESGERDMLSWDEFGQLRDRTTTFSATMASETSLNSWQLRYQGSDWEEAHGRLVSGGYFHLLGIAPAIGRLLTEADDHEDSPYAVISYDYWQRRFAGSPAVLGRSITLRKALLTIVGVAPRGFIGETFGQDPDLWVSMRMEPFVISGDDRLHDVAPSKSMWLHVFGRLKPGVTLARAEAESNAIFKSGLEQFYGGVASPERRKELLDQKLKARAAAGGASGARGDFSTSLSALMAAVGVLLLIACANLANLLLARGAVRKPEMALRLSLGASRGRLIRQLITESLVLAAMGAVCGLAVARLIFGILSRMIAQGQNGFSMAFALDPMAMAFTLGVTVSSALLLGLLPAWQVTRTDASAALKEQGRAGGSLGRMRLGRSLVSLQLALSLPLLACAGLLARTVYNLQHVDLGYSRQRLVMTAIDSRTAGYNSERSGVLFRDLLARIKGIPGVAAVTYSHNGLFTGSNSSDLMQAEGYTPKGQNDTGSSWEFVGPNYFSTLHVPLLVGRDILESDDAAAPKVCVVNEAFAKKFFDGRNPLGLHVTMIDEGVADQKRTAYQVVGVARNFRTNSLRDKIGTWVYLPFAQPHADSVKRANYLIRTTTDSAAVLPAVRQAIQKVDASLPIFYAQTLEEKMAPWTAQDRITAQVAVVFGISALVLAAIGLYGVLSYNVARRRSEIAIRIALGAQPGGVIRMVLRETSVLVIAGIVVGGGLTYAASRWIASQLYGVAPQDPLVLTMAPTLLVAVALGAVYLPAWRASRVAPMEALRQE